MRQVTAFMVLFVMMSGLACLGTPRRNMRPPDTQYWDLPSSDAEWASQPPTYPKDEGLLAPPKNKDGIPKNLGQGGGGMGSPGMGGGGMGSPGMGGAGMGNPSMGSPR